MIAILFITQSQRVNQEDALGTAQIANQERVYQFVTMYGDIFDDDSNGATIVIRAIDDPSCPTFDDEITLEITFTIPDVDALPINEDIDLSTNDLLETALNMTCFCDFDSGSADYTLSGTIRFTDLSTDFAEGTLALTLDGDIPAMDGTLFAQDTTLNVDIPLFRAPVSVDNCDYG